MKKYFFTFVSIFFLFELPLLATNYIFTVEGKQTLLNGQPITVIGLRCSNALYSDRSSQELIEQMDLYKSYGINTLSVFIMGSRFGDIKGYHEDATLNKKYLNRLAKIIKAADRKGMIILVGCLYWGGSEAKWEDWEQKDAENAVANTVKWLSENEFRNVFIDVDNEGMAMKAKNFDPEGLVERAKKVDPSIMVATNFHGIPPAAADLGVHFSAKVGNKPYIESEGTPDNAPGGYWGSYSKKDGYYNYINIGIYTPEMKARQIEITKSHLSKGYGYMMASTWLQCVPPDGPNAAPGGEGTASNPGILWWLEAVKQIAGSYVPPGIQ